ncbi:hypothetical protein H4R35_006647, partial [Dimargaris xerosporica]
WVVPTRSHYTSESYFEFKHGKNPECCMISAAEAQAANGPDYTLLLAYLDANHRGAVGGDGTRVRAQVTPSKQSGKLPLKRPRCESPDSETTALSARESVPDKPTATLTNAAVPSPTGSLSSSSPASSLAWSMDPSAMGMNAFTQATLGQLWADSSMQLPMMNMANVALDFSIPLLSTVITNASNPTEARPDHQTTAESRSTMVSLAADTDTCPPVPVCMADSLAMTPAAQLPTSLMANAALGSTWAQLTQPPPADGLPSYTASTALPAANTGNNTATAQQLTTGINQFGDEELQALLGRIVPSSGSRGASQLFPAN